MPEVAFFFRDFFIFILVVSLNSLNYLFNYPLVVILLIFVSKFGFEFVVKGYEDRGEGEGFVLDIS